jgi:hypothetical protein
MVLVIKLLLHAYAYISLEVFNGCMEFIDRQAHFPYKRVLMPDMPDNTVADLLEQPRCNLHPVFNNIIQLHIIDRAVDVIKIRILLIILTFKIDEIVTADLIFSFIHTMKGVDLNILQMYGDHIPSDFIDKNLSASSAAMHPLPAAVTACL